MDPERLIHAADAPPELLELVRSTARPPDLRPALRAEIARDVARRTVWHGGWIGPGLGVAVTLSVAAGVLYAIASPDTMDEPPRLEAVELRSIPASEMLEDERVEAPAPPQREELGHSAPDERDGEKTRRRGDPDNHAVGQVRPPPQTASLDRAAIMLVVTSHRAALQLCATATGVRDGSSVRISAAITIQPSGRVASVSATSPGPHASAILPCVETKIRTWVFPPSSTPITVRIPFLLVFPADPTLAVPEAPTDVSMEVPAMEAPPSMMEAGETPEQRALRELRGTRSHPRIDEPSEDPVQACAAEGFGEPMNRCVVRTVRPSGQRNLRALAMAHRGLGDRANACRTMRLYVERYGSTDAANEFRQYMILNCFGD